MGGSGAPDKIIFITPPGHCGVVDVVGRWLPLNYVYLAGSARKAGFSAEIYDARAKNHGFAEIEQKLRTAGATYIAISAITSTVNTSIKILELAKRINPAVITIMGGIHATFCYEEVLGSTPAVDYIICGEGETTIGELLQVLEMGGDPAAVAGLAFVRNGTVVKTAEREKSEDVDDLPTAWDLLQWQDYQYFVIPDSRLAVVCTSREDMQRDHHVVEPRTVSSLRLRDPQRVVDEMARLNADYAANVFLFADESPAVSRDRWERLLDLLIARNLGLCLLLQSSIADIIRDHDILWKYRKAGVIHLYITISDTDQECSSSGAELGKQAVESVHAHGIISEISFVIGSPSECRAGVERTLKLAQFYNPDNVQFLAYTPWPYGAIMQEGLRLNPAVADYGKYNLIDPVVEPEQMSLLQVEVAMVDCYRRFYMGKMLEIMTLQDEFKRNYLAKAMKLIVGSSFIMKKLGMGTLNKVPVAIGEMMAKMKK